MESIRDIEFTEIAADWDSAPLGREHEPLLLLMCNGLTIGQSKQGGELQVTRIETISDGIIDEQKVRWVSGLKPDQIEKYRIQKGDIPLSHINSDRHLGKSAIALKDYSDLLHGMNLLLLRANREVLEPEFLHFVLCYYRTKGVFITICSRSVNQSSINQAKLKALKIPLPPLLEQRRIATVLGLVQRVIEQQGRLIALTTELKKTLLHKLFTEGLRGEPQKQTEIGPVPERWEVVLLKDCAVVQTGVAKGRKLDGKDSLTLPYLRVANVQSGFLDLREMKTITIRSKEKSRYLLQNGDVVLTEGGDFDKLGRGFIWKGEIDDCVHQNHIFAVRIDRSRLLPEFSRIFRRAPTVRSTFYL
jgi:type I restriction enzyme, S subunit